MGRWLFLLYTLFLPLLLTRGSAAETRTVTTRVPTPTTPTATATATPTVAPFRTLTATPTATATATATATVTPSRTLSYTPTTTISHTQSVILSATPSEAVLRTPTPTAVPSSTATQVVAADPVGACSAVCIPQSDWNGTHCVRSAADTEHTTPENFPLYVALGVFSTFVAVILAAFITDCLLDPETRLPQVPPGTDLSLPTSHWTPHVGRSFRVIEDDRTLGAVLEDHKELIMASTPGQQWSTLKETYLGHAGARGELIATSPLPGGNGRALTRLRMKNDILWFPPGTLVKEEVEQVPVPSVVRSLPSNDITEHQMSARGAFASPLSVGFLSQGRGSFAAASSSSPGNPVDARVQSGALGLMSQSEVPLTKIPTPSRTSDSHPD